MKISQVFGPTFQGEGSAAGRHCLFVRTYGCNLECTWCDTAYTWADTPRKAAMTQSGHMYDRNDPVFGLKEMSTDEVLKVLSEHWDFMARPTTVIISGGEPMMQQTELIELCRSLRNWNNEVHIETAGTIAPTYDLGNVVTQYNVSPKLRSSGNVLSKRYRPEVLRILQGSGRAWFKFVVTRETCEADLREIDDIVENCSIRPTRVMIMPEGVSSEAVLTTARRIAPLALSRGYGLSLRTHILLWGDSPGR